MFVQRALARILAHVFGHGGEAAVLRTLKAEGKTPGDVADLWTMCRLLKIVGEQHRVCIHQIFDRFPITPVKTLWRHATTATTCGVLQGWTNSAVLPPRARAGKLITRMVSYQTRYPGYPKRGLRALHGVPCPRAFALTGFYCSGRRLPANGCQGLFRRCLLESFPGDSSFPSCNGARIPPPLVFFACLADGTTS